MPKTILDRNWLKWFFICLPKQIFYSVKLGVDFDGCGFITGKRYIDPSDNTIARYIDFCSICQKPSMHWTRRGSRYDTEFYKDYGARKL